MINFFYSTNRKIFVFVLAMVAFATVLVAQITPHKQEAAPAETGQANAVTTPY